MSSGFEEGKDKEYDNATQLESVPGERFHILLKGV